MTNNGYVEFSLNTLWELKANDGGRLGISGENKAAEIKITVEDMTPYSAYDFFLDVEDEYGQKATTLFTKNLTYSTLTIPITTGILGMNGKKIIQVRATKALSETEIITKKSTAAVVICDYGVNATETFPQDLPSEFEQFEQRILDIIGGASGVENIYMTATTDNTTGTPNVNVTKTVNEDNTVTFNLVMTGFKGAKGDRGAAGQDGITPKITATASVDTTQSGTAGVDVSKTGTDENMNFAFAFHNIKGEKGDKGDKGDTGDKGDKGDRGAAGQDGITPQITATASVDTTQSGTAGVDVSKTGTDESMNFAFAFHNIKGEKGDKGDKGDTGDRGPAGQDAELPSGTTGQVLSIDSNGDPVFVNIDTLITNGDNISY